MRTRGFVTASRWPLYDVPVPSPLQIGPLSLATNLLLAPMVDYAELPYRLVVRSIGGVGLTFTPLLSPQGVLRGGPHSLRMAALDPADRPVAMQFFGADPHEMADATRWARDAGADAVDLNLGCPSETIIRQVGGSELLRRPDLVLRMVERMVAAAGPTPVTVKMRLGWDDKSLVAPWLAARLEELGVAAITVHGRTKRMKFGGICRLDGIAAVVAAVKRIPVIGNGDVRTPAHAERMIRATGCRGVMIGRGAVGQPWVFRDVWSYLTTGVVPPEPTRADKCRWMRDHFAHHARLMDERSAVLMFRKRISWYGGYLQPCRAMKEQMRQIDTAADFERVLAEFEHHRTL